MSEKVSGRSSASRMWVDDLAYGPERRHRHEVRLHETAGGVLGVFEVALECRAIPRSASAPGFPAAPARECSRAGRRASSVSSSATALASTSLGSAGSSWSRTVSSSSDSTLRLKSRSQRLDQLHALCRLQQLDEIGEVGRLHGPRQGSAHVLPGLAASAAATGLASSDAGALVFAAHFVRGLCLHPEGRPV